MSQSRREFIKKSAITCAGFYIGANAFSAKSYRNILGANDRVRVGVVGFSDRHQKFTYSLFYESLQGIEF